MHAPSSKGPGPCSVLDALTYLGGLDELSLGAKHRQAEEGLGHPCRGGHAERLEENGNVREPGQLERGR